VRGELFCDPSWGVTRTELADPLVGGNRIMSVSEVVLNVVMFQIPIMVICIWNRELTDPRLDGDMGKKKESAPSHMVLHKGRIWELFPSEFELRVPGQEPTMVFSFPQL
jgi:hypothetical protein